jgi:amino acid transporter
LYLIASVGMHAAVPTLPVWGWIVIFVAVNTLVNYLGIRMTAVVTSIMLVCELIVLAIFLAVGVWALLHGRGRGFHLDPLLNPATAHWSMVFGAVSVAVLSFLGFDGISMLAEENRGGSRQIGRAMVAALVMSGALFIAQTWVAALLVTDPARLISHGDPNGTAFYDAARVAGGPWLATLTAVATAIAWGIANSLVAQVATSRLLYAMARDRQLPGFLARISVRRSVPTNAITVVALVSLALGLYMAHRADGIALMSSLINFGALSAFLLLHVSVVWHYLVRRHSRNVVAHLLVPLIGFAILLTVVINANVAAQRLGLVWLGVGVVILGGLYAAGRRPELSGQSMGGDHA